MPKEIFATGFKPFACFGDTIEAKALLGPWSTGLRLEATLYQDDDSSAPDERQDGFWPSLDPNSDGYIGPKSAAALRRATAKAESVMQAWRDDEWHYCGVAVRAWFDDVPLTGEFAHAVWGSEMNYPGKGNTNGHLLDLANEEAYSCAQEAIRALTAIVEESGE